MEQRHEIHETTFSPETMHTISRFHTHMNELDSHVSNFKTTMMTSKYLDTSHMSKVERDMVVLQDHLKTHDKDATT